MLCGLGACLPPSSPLLRWPRTALAVGACRQHKQRPSPSPLSLPSPPHMSFHPHTDSPLHTCAQPLSLPPACSPMHVFAHACLPPAPPGRPSLPPHSTFPAHLRLLLGAGTTATAAAAAAMMPQAQRRAQFLTGGCQGLKRSLQLVGDVGGVELGGEVVGLGRAGRG